MLDGGPRHHARMLVSRSGRAHHENWFINLLVAFQRLWEPQRHCPLAMASIQRWAVAHPEAASDPTAEIGEKRLSNRVMIVFR